MKNWFRSVSGTVRLRVVCPSPERFLNLCAREGVPMWDTVREDACALSLRVPAPRLDAVRSLAARCGGETTPQAVQGLPRVKRLARRRAFALVLLFLAAALALVSSAFLWEIRVTGNETVPTGVILRALDECGFSVGKCWLTMESQALQSELISRVPALEWVSFQIRGSRADVRVYEAEPAPELIDNDEPVDLVASHAGVVTKLTVLQGAPMIERGAVAEPGQVLVSGTVTDRQGEGRSVHSLGSVRARTYYEITACLPRTAAVRSPAGRSRSRWALILGKKRINFYQNSGIPDAECDTIYHVYVCAVPGLFRLPAALAREEVRPMQHQSRERTEQEARALLESSLRETLLRSLGEDGEILDLSFTPGASEDAFYLTLRAECEQEIAQPYPKLPSQKGITTHDRTDDSS